MVSHHPSHPPAAYCIIFWIRNIFAIFAKLHTVSLYVIHSILCLISCLSDICSASFIYIVQITFTLMCRLKDSATRFLLQVFYESVSPKPLSIPVGLFRFFSKFTEIFATQGASPAKEKFFNQKSFNI
jgi:hypothetical protein